MSFSLKKIDVADGSVELTLARQNAVFELLGRRESVWQGRSSAWSKYEYVKNPVPSRRFNGVFFYYIGGELPKYLEIINPRSNFYRLYRCPDKSTLLAEVTEEELKDLPEWREEWAGSAKWPELTELRKVAGDENGRIVKMLSQNLAETAREMARRRGDYDTDKAYYEAATAPKKPVKDNKKIDYAQPKRKIRFEE
jgi:hypothetical protein